MADDEYEFLKNRKAGKTYISRVFKYGSSTTERIRNVKMVFEDNDSLHFGELHGAVCLRLSGEKRKTQVTALVSQDSKGVKRITLQTFKSYSDDHITGIRENEFTFRAGEFENLLAFLNRIEFIDFSNEANFQIEDVSSRPGPKAIVDASDRQIIDQIRNMTKGERAVAFRNLQSDLTSEEINLLLGRKQALEVFEKEIRGTWSESNWQDFFEHQEWVFGYGLDYRILRQFDREATVGISGTDNSNKPVVDFLMTFTDYTVLVEIKKPSTYIFKKSRNGRAGTWDFSAEFIGAISQILEQKAEWLACAQIGDHFSRDGSRQLAARTKNSRAVLVIGSDKEFSQEGSRNEQIKRDTFELFRRECSSIDIITFDELLERARFITRNP